ncbi:hypothetical protein C8T65DRAFT_744187 [Cerioporus squamosus]|nr:hypothetical protein C8T65DRAFT_744187 [Cerioporus squamosus]
MSFGQACPQTIMMLLALQHRPSVANPRARHFYNSIQLDESAPDGASPTKELTASSAEASTLPVRRKGAIDLQLEMFVDDGGGDAAERGEKDWEGRVLDEGVGGITLTTVSTPLTSFARAAAILGASLLNDHPAAASDLSTTRKWRSPLISSLSRPRRHSTNSTSCFSTTLALSTTIHPMIAGLLIRMYVSGFSPTPVATLLTAAV